MYVRDEGRCTYTDDHGRRYPERAHLEFHHHELPYGRGGDHSPDNVRLACRARAIAEVLGTNRASAP